MNRRLKLDPLPHLEAVAAAVAAAEQPQASFAALDRAMAATIGHKLFTILLFHEESGESERFYSNRPAAYPVGGRKPLNETFWTQQVLHEQRPYFGNTAEDIRSVFFDHELIFSLGCESILNLPVVCDGRTLGTINLLHEANWYEAADAVLGAIFCALAVPGYLLLTR